MAEKQKSTLFVDLDGTLVKTDLLYESLWSALRRKPMQGVLALLRVFSGRAALKQRLAELSEIDPALLPYQEKFLEFLRREHAQDRQLVLATASDRALAERIAAYLGIFDEILASDGKENLKGKIKLARIKDRAGGGAFAYAGNSLADIPIWKEAEEVYVVESYPGISHYVRKAVQVTQSFPTSTLKTMAVVRALRMHQWVKNLLIFVPLTMAHQIHNPTLLWGTIAAFLSFCFTASSVYLINDLLDLEADRQHHQKRFRPFASGDLLIPMGMLLVPLLLLLGFLIALTLTRQFQIILAVYFVLTLLYSFRLKQIAIIDVILLAGLYALRVLAGGYAVNVRVSEWLLAFSMFFFLSLACVKRFSELLSLRRGNREESKGRGYTEDDLEMIGTFGASSGYLSVLVLALYVNSREVMTLYAEPKMLWLICPVLLFWISRVWLIGHRGELHEDPIVFAIRDKVSYFVGALSALVLLIAI